MQRSMKKIKKKLLTDGEKFSVINIQNMNNGPTIIQRQNLKANLDMLLAQRRLYSQGKNYQYALILIIVIIPIIIAFINKSQNTKFDEYNWIFIVYSIGALMVEKLLELIIDIKKKTAASIQEKFDIDVYNLTENELLNTTFVDEILVRRFSKKDRNDVKKVERVKNWYSTKIENIRTNLAILLCQRMNICYDHNIKKKYNLLLIIISITTFFILLSISLFEDMTLKKFVVEVMFPSLPLFNFTYKEVKINIESTDNLQKLREQIEERLNTSYLGAVIDEEDLRSIQDRIYNNRLLSPLIPDFIYKKMWGKLEDEMNYSVEHKIESLR